jgi:CubicO group peptidase (beta-lactamase class C family)
VQDRIVPAHGISHARVITFPACRTALDVGEGKGDGTGGYRCTRLHAGTFKITCGYAWSNTSTSGRQFTKHAISVRLCKHHRTRFKYGVTMISHIRRGVVALAAVALTGTSIVFVGCSSPRAAHPAEQVDAAAVDAAVAPYVGTQVPGLSIAVGYHGHVIFAEAYGKADLASGSPMTAQTRLGVGSLIKQMTSGALLTLERDKRLSIDDKVSVILPRYVYGNRMTLRQLATMSAGLQGALAHPIGDKTFGIVGAQTGKSTVAQVYVKLNVHPPIRPAGTQWDYANIGYWLLGRTIEAAAKRPYADAMQARVFGPLGMKSAYIRGKRPDTNFATGYSRFEDGTFHKCPELNFSTSDAAGMGAMTASDVIVWDEAVRAQRLVRGPLAKAMFTPNGLPLPKGVGLPGDSYAMGWYTRNNSVMARGVYDHDGNTNLFTSENVLFPDGSDVVLLSNAQYNKFGIDRHTIAYKVHNAIAGLTPVKVFDITASANITACQNE